MFEMPFLVTWCPVEGSSARQLQPWSSCLADKAVEEWASEAHCGLRGGALQPAPRCLARGGEGARATVAVQLAVVARQVGHSRQVRFFPFNVSNVTVNVTFNVKKPWVLHIQRQQVIKGKNH